MCPYLEIHNNMMMMMMMMMMMIKIVPDMAAVKISNSDDSGLLEEMVKFHSVFIAVSSVTVHVYIPSSDTCTSDICSIIGVAGSTLILLEVKFVVVLVLFFPNFPHTNTWIPSFAHSILTALSDELQRSVTFIPRGVLIETNSSASQTRENGCNQDMS